ncbi:MAG: hypothetical protein ABFR97_00005 [Thermodesulfobacteriota bacterium]
MNSAISSGLVASLSFLLISCGGDASDSGSSAANRSDSSGLCQAQKIIATVEWEMTPFPSPFECVFSEDPACQEEPTPVWESNTVIFTYDYDDTGRPLVLGMEVDETQQFFYSGNLTTTYTYNNSSGPPAAEITETTDITTGAVLAVATTYYEYDRQGKPSFKRVEYDNDYDGLVDSVATTTYVPVYSNSTAKLLSMAEETSYDNDNDGSMDEVRTVNYTFDENGNTTLLLEELRSNSADMEGYRETNIYRYDNAGNQVSSSYSREELDGTISAEGVSTFYYDDAGNMTLQLSEHTYADNLGSTDAVTYSYSHDDKGNLLFRKAEGDNGNDGSINYRTTEVYEDYRCF